MRLWECVEFEKLGIWRFLNWNNFKNDEFSIREFGIGELEIGELEIVELGKCGIWQNWRI